MPAIITDNLKLQNCTNFVNSIKYVETNPSQGNYYVFIGYPNPDEYWTSWDSNLPNPIDNLNYENSYKESILGVKKITSSDVIRAIPKVVWNSGTRYDMYRHDYSAYNLSSNSGLSSLYDSQYYVMTSDFNVYICLNNGASIANTKGVPSTIEPVHTDPNDYTDKGDGYVWKYLYTINPADYLKFDSTDYIPVPNDWETTNNAAISEVRSSAINGGIITILLETSTQYLVADTGITCPIKGDGSGGTALVTFDTEGYPIKVQVTNPGSGYTYATLDLDSVAPRDVSIPKSIFNVIIPPPGGHGANIYKELGAYRCLVYSRIENPITNPDFVVDNQFSRIGIIKNVLENGSSSYFSSSTGSGVYGIILSSTSISASPDDSINQATTSAKGTIVSTQEIGSVTVVKYIQSREPYVDTYSLSPDITKTFDQYITNSNFSGISTASSYQYSSFNTSSVTIADDVTPYNVATTINGSQYLGEYLGQSFITGLSTPDINTKSGDILYIDNRSTITRASNQREDLKIIIEF